MYIDSFDINIQSDERIPAWYEAYEEYMAQESMRLDVEASIKAEQEYVLSQLVEDDLPF